MIATLTLATSTRNPTPPIFRRVLESVAALRRPPGVVVEYLITDSTSEPPLSSRPEMVAYLAKHPWCRLLRATEPGVAAARRHAVAAAQGDLIVWFDDDNVPAEDYLEQVVATAAAWPEATVWGAGTIDVEFVDAVPGWVERELRPMFQERRHGRDEFGRTTSWADFFPFGTGLVTRRAAAMRWAAASTEGRYTLTGRSGAQLTAGEDAQIILGAVAAGESVGVAAGQRLTHLIPARRCTVPYLTRLEFGLSASIRVARAECFPDDPAPRSLAGLGPVQALRSTIARGRRAPTGGRLREARFEAARRLGALSGTLETTNRPEPIWLRAAIALLGLR